MEQMFDVFADNDKFLMRCSLDIIRTIWDLHPTAVKRIDAETKEPGGVCKLHHNGRPRLGGQFVMVQRAVNTLGVQRG